MGFRMGAQPQLATSRVPCTPRLSNLVAHNGRSFCFGGSTQGPRPTTALLPVRKRRAQLAPLMAASSVDSPAAVPASLSPAPVAVVAAPANQLLPPPVPWQEAQQGMVYFSDGRCSFRVWAPHASSVTLQLVPADQFTPTPEPKAEGEGEGEGAAEAAPTEIPQPNIREIPLNRHQDDWGADLVSRDEQGREWESGTDVQLWLATSRAGLSGRAGTVDSLGVSHNSHMHCQTGLLCYSCLHALPACLPHLPRLPTLFRLPACFSCCPN